MLAVCIDGHNAAYLRIRAEDKGDAALKRRALSLIGGLSNNVSLRHPADLFKNRRVSRTAAVIDYYDGFISSGCKLRRELPDYVDQDWIRPVRGNEYRDTDASSVHRRRRAGLGYLFQGHAEFSMPRGRLDASLRQSIRKIIARELKIRL